MPPRKRREAPKTVVKEEQEEIDPKRIVSDAALQFIDSLEEQVKDKAEEILAMQAAIQQSVREEFQLQLIKLPKQVREMPIKLFKEQYGGDITSVLLQDMEQRLAASTKALVPATSLRTWGKGAQSAMPTQMRTRTRGMGAETPAVGLAASAPAGTMMRAPRGNEILYSKNGSPLGFLEQKAGQAAVLRTTAKAHTTELPVLPAPANTVLQLGRPGSKTGVADNLSICLKNGEQVQVDFDGGLDKVPEQHKAEVVAHLNALQKFATSITGGRRRR